MSICEYCCAHSLVFMSVCVHDNGMTLLKCHLHALLACRVWHIEHITVPACQKRF